MFINLFYQNDKKNQKANFIKKYEFLWSKSIIYTYNITNDCGLFQHKTYTILIKTYLKQNKIDMFKKLW